MCVNQYPEIEKVLTEASLIDEIVYEVRQILKGIVVKDQERADNAETLKSLREADLYHDIQMGTDIFKNYTYTYDLFMKIPSMTPDRAIMYAREELPIPEGLKPELQRLAREEWLSKYEDTNNYYRELWGKPNIGDPYIYLTEKEYEMIPVESYDISKPVHECNVSEAALLYTSGVIDSMKERHPEAKYLDHLGERSIDPYIARRSPKFGLLYIPPVDSPEVSMKWRERFEINRVYLLKTIYSEAYHFHSDYYDRFMIMLIIIMTFDDMIVFSPEYIIDRELFDLRTIQYLFEACGVTFFPEIPLKYQKRLIKNLNRLIKYKSSAKCMVDIVSLFGYDNMQLFKYYIMKTPNLNEDGTYRKDTITDPDTGLEVPDLESNYTLQFLKVPLLGIADDYIQDPLQYVDYDDTAANDIWWNGVYTHDYVKHEILEHEFDLHISKYISVDTVYSMAEMQFQMVYFMNMMLYSEVNTDLLLVDVPEIASNTQFKLVDLIVMLFALGYMYQGIKDNIIYDPIQAIDILGFNFTTDLGKLTQFVEDHGFTIEELGLDKFINPNPIGIRSFDELEEIYQNNKDVYDNLVWLMNNANNYDEYLVFKEVYESLYITRLSFDMFRDYSINGQEPKTYTEYIRNSNVGLYNVLMNCDAIQKETERQQEISRVINFIVEDIYVYLDKDMFKYVFNYIPTINLDYIRKYIWNILDFFKSYKVDVLHTNIIYKFDDRLHNKVRIYDRLLFHYIYTRTDRVNIRDCAKFLNTVNYKEYIKIVEQLHFDITYWKEKHFYDYVWIHDEFGGLLSRVHWHDHVRIWDTIAAINHVYTWGDLINVRDCMNNTIIKNPKDRVGIEDVIYFKYVDEHEPLT